MCFEDKGRFLINNCILIGPGRAKSKYNLWKKATFQVLKRQASRDYFILLHFEEKIRSIISGLRSLPFDLEESCIFLLYLWFGFTAIGLARPSIFLSFGERRESNNVFMILGSRRRPTAVRSRSWHCFWIHLLIARQKEDGSGRAVNPKSWLVNRLRFHFLSFRNLRHRLTSWHKDLDSLVFFILSPLAAGVFFIHCLYDRRQRRWRKPMTGKTMLSWNQISTNLGPQPRRFGVKIAFSCHGFLKIKNKFPPTTSQSPAKHNQDKRRWRLRRG